MTIPPVPPAHSFDFEQAAMRAAIAMYEGSGLGGRAGFSWQMDQGVLAQWRHYAALALAAASWPPPPAPTEDMIVGSILTTYVGIADDPELALRTAVRIAWAAGIAADRESTRLEAEQAKARS
jgi:hypothetical protein